MREIERAREERERERGVKQENIKNEDNEAHCGTTRAQPGSVAH